jgi:hypothetical protein
LSILRFSPSATTAPTETRNTECAPRSRVRRGVVQSACPSRPSSYGDGFWPKTLTKRFASEVYRDRASAASGGARCCRRGRHAIGPSGLRLVIDKMPGSGQQPLILKPRPIWQFHRNQSPGPLIRQRGWPDRSTGIKRFPRRSLNRRRRCCSNAPGETAQNRRGGNMLRSSARAGSASARTPSVR